MSGELKAPGGPDNTVYAIIALKDDFWNGTALAEYSSGSYANYDIPLSHVGSTYLHMGNFPTGITTSGVYDVFYYIQAGASPAEGDIQIASGTVSWSGTRQTFTETATSNRTALLRTSYQANATINAIIFNGATVWNGTSFETFTSGNFATYLVSTTESGDTGIYTADLPSGITAENLYEVFFILGSTEASPIVGVTSFVYSSTASSAVTLTGTLSGPDLYAQFLRTFKRTDKETEFYDALTDTVQELLRRYQFDEVTTSATFTDTISSLGEWRLDGNANVGLLAGDVVLLDGGNSYPLFKVTPSEFDRRYPNPDYVSSDRGTPQVWTYRGGQVWIGPIPDSVSYTYKIAQSARLNADITATTESVPLSATYRELLKAGCLHRVFESMEAYDKSEYWRGKFEILYNEAETREIRNRATVGFTRSSFCLPGD